MLLLLTLMACASDKTDLACGELADDDVVCQALCSSTLTVTLASAPAEYSVTLEGYDTYDCEGTVDDDTICDGTAVFTLVGESFPETVTVSTGDGSETVSPDWAYESLCGQCCNSAAVEVDL